MPAIRENMTHDVKKNNCRLIFETLRKSDGMTLLDLEWNTSLSRPTVVNVVRMLEEKGLIIEIGKKDSTGGRAPVIYGVNPKVFYAIGVDFEFPVSRVAISNFTGEVEFHSRKEFDATLTSDEVIKLLVEQIKEIIEKSHIPIKQFLGIGLGMPGSLDLQRGISVRFERVSGWEEVDIKGIITNEIGIPVFLANDVHLMYRAEREMWKKKNSQDVLFVAIRSGIGMAVFQKGHILEGEFGNAGYIGHMVIQAEGPQCNCGNYGCLEMYASDKAIVEKYNSLTGEKVKEASVVANRANEGEEEAKRVLEESGKYLGIGIGNAVSLFDINNIIVSTCFDGTIFLESAQKQLDRCVNEPQKRSARIYPSKLTEDKFAGGGCKLVFRRTSSKIIESIQYKKM